MYVRYKLTILLYHILVESVEDLRNKYRVKSMPNHDEIPRA